MAKDRLAGTLAVILHADVAGSTALVQQDEQLAHERIQDAFRRFGAIIEKYQGHVLEIRGDALLAEFVRTSDAVSASLAFQADHTYQISRLNDDLRPTIRVGIAMGEVVIADATITGAGVVLAQRVEQLADPGGLCITAALHEALPKRLPFELKNLGEHNLKGFEEPVRVYRVELSPGALIPEPQARYRRKFSSKSWNLYTTLIAGVIVIAVGMAIMFGSPALMEEPASPDPSALPLPDKPSIAVLPFNNMSSDREQEYFVDGMTEDLITDLSRISGLFVVSRHSSFTFKNKSVTPQEVASKLGVKYVLEGSVRRINDDVRINVQLIDAVTGGHLWAQRYDEKLDNVFALQDQITHKITQAMSVALTPQEQLALEVDETISTAAYEQYLKGLEHFRRQTPSDFGKARGYWEQAVAIDPDFYEAYAALAALYWEPRVREWYPALGIGYWATQRGAVAYLEKSEPRPTAIALMTSARMKIKLGEHLSAIESAEQAIVLSPNNSDVHSTLAEILIFAGHPKLAFEHIDQALRLDPLHQAYAYYLRGLASYALEDFEATSNFVSKALELNPGYLRPAVVLAAAYGMQNNSQKASESLKLYHSEYSGVWANINSTILIAFPYKHNVDRERLAAGMHKAGMSTDQTYNTN